MSCHACGAEVGPGLLACPACGALVHSARLKELAARAEAAPSPAEALAAWREALLLLPVESKQREQVAARIVALSATVDAPAPAASRGAGLAAVGAVALGVVGKLKLVVAGLVKLPTLGSMLLAFGAYLGLFGWRFALGLLVTTYLHEMGHVWALRRYGIAATAPMFVPGFGAFVRLRQPLATVLEDARVGLAGPWWGAVASAAAVGIGMAAGWRSWIAIGQASAWINLFNLTPFGSLDGGRAFRALGRAARGLVAVALVVAWLGAGEGLLFLLALAAAARTFGAAPGESSRAILVEYVALVAALAGLGAVAAHQLGGHVLGGH